MIAKMLMIDLYITSISHLPKENSTFLAQQCMPKSKRQLTDWINCDLILIRVVVVDIEETAKN